VARIETDPNYTSPTFSRATAATDLFKKEDVQQLAAALSSHNHDGAGKGLAVSAPGSIPGASLVVGSVTSSQIADGTIQAVDLADGSVTSPKFAANPTLPGTTTVSQLQVGGSENITGNSAINGNLTAVGGINANGGVNLGNVMHALNHPIDGVSTLSFQSGASLTAGGTAPADHVVVTNSLDVSFDLLVGRNTQMNGATTVTGLITGGGLQINGNGNLTGTINATQATLSNGNLYLGSRHIYDAGGSSGIHMDWDLRIDGGHDVFTHSIHLVASSGDCHIDSASGQMDIYGPNGPTNLRVFHIDSSWMGVQAANFSSQSTGDAKAGATSILDSDCMARIRMPLNVTTWSTPGVPGPTGQSDIGFLAEDVQSVVPEACSYNTDNSLFGLSYDSFIGLLWGALRSLDARCTAKGI
jgi:hypothetical protein